MKTLFGVHINWSLYIFTLIFIKLIWVGLSWLSFFALAITLHQFFLLFYSIGSAIPIRYLAGSFMCLQMLLGPTLAFNGLDAYQTNSVYKMKISETQYFEYLLPAMVLFIAGLHVTAGKLKGEVINEFEIRKFIDRSGRIPLVFIATGFFSSLLYPFFGSELGFVFYLLGSFKFVGLFMLLLGSQKLKLWALILVFGSIIATTLQKAMFHDLLTWLIMLGAVLGIKYKPSILLKAGVALGFIIIAVVIQQVKGDYRKAAWEGRGGGAGIESFENTINEKQDDNALFSTASLAKSNLRINQGFIVTNIMTTVPDKVPYENGSELLVLLEAAFLPRIIAPNKLNAGDRTIFMKYSGMMIQKGTSMGLGAVGDGYINFGIAGGSIFMFFLGLLFSSVLNIFYSVAKYYPILLLFTPLVFYYPIRPDCELQTSLGHLVKSCMLIFIIFQVWKYHFRRVEGKRLFKVSSVKNN